MMDEYVLKDVTENAKAIAETPVNTTNATNNSDFGNLPRVPLKSSFTKKGKTTVLKLRDAIPFCMAKSLSIFPVWNN